jgi:hypothetical protein
MTITQKSNVKATVKHLMRQIARVSNPQIGYQSVSEVDNDLSSLLLQGYRIIGTHYLGKQMDTILNVEFFGILYILQLEQSEIEKMKMSFTKQVEKKLEVENVPETA